MFLNFLIFLFIFSVLYFCYIYIEVNTRLEYHLGKRKYKSLKTFCSKIKKYNQKIFYDNAFDIDHIVWTMIISAIFYGILFSSTYTEKSISVLRKNNASVEFLETYDRFGIERQRKFIENKYSMYDMNNAYYNKKYFEYLYKAGEDVSNYVDVSLDGEVLMFKIPNKSLLREN